MKIFVSMLALAGLLTTAAFADDPGGISGYVIDLHSGQPIPHATILYYRAPYLENGPNHIQQLTTDRNGFFTDITLEPGRYVVMTRIPGKVLGCAVDDVMGGEVAHIRIEVGHDHIMCSGPRVHPAMIDPNATADVYRI